MNRNKEFLQYIKDTGYDDLLDFDEKTILIYKNTLHYQVWQLKYFYKEFAKDMRETKIGTAIIWVIDFLDKCFNKIFRVSRK